MKNNNLNIFSIISNVNASLEIEGLKPSEYAQEIGKQYLKDKIDIEAAVELIKNKHSKLKD